MSSINKTPKDIIRLRQWVCYKEQEAENGRKTKKPINPNLVGLKPAKTNDPKTWSTYQETIRAMINLGADGIGFVFTENDPYLGIDLDKCRDPETGAIVDWAIQIVQAINSYTEIYAT